MSQRRCDSESAFPNKMLGPEIKKILIIWCLGKYNNSSNGFYLCLFLAFKKSLSIESRHSQMDYLRNDYDTYHSKINCSAYLSNFFIARSEYGFVRDLINFLYLEV